MADRGDAETGHREQTLREFTQTVRTHWAAPLQLLPRMLRTVSYIIENDNGQVIALIRREKQQDMQRASHDALAVQHLITIGATKLYAQERQTEEDLVVQVKPRRLRILRGQPGMLPTGHTEAEHTDEDVLSEAYLGKSGPYDPPDTCAIILKARTWPMADMFAAVALFLAGGDVEEQLFIRSNDMPLQPSESKENRTADIAERVEHVKHQLQVLRNAFASSLELLASCDMDMKADDALEVLASLTSHKP